METQKEPSTKKSPIFWIIMVVILLITAGVAYGVLSKNYDTYSSDTDSSDTEIAANDNSKIYNISYTDSCYDPETTTINKGDTVVFTNNSSSKMWPASDNHPSHTKYPEFDAKRSIANGETYSFTFEKSGTWGMHDHIKDSCEGSITVN